MIRAGAILALALLLPCLLFGQTPQGHHGASAVGTRPDWTPPPYFGVQVTTTTSPQSFGFLITTGPTSLFIDWGDGASTTAIYGGQVYAHSYATAGTRTVKMSGSLNSLRFYYSGGPPYTTPTLVTGIEPIGGIVFNSEAAFNSMFDRCSNLVTIPTNMFRAYPQKGDFSLTFSRCTSLRNLPPDLFRYQTSCYGFWYTFLNCSNVIYRDDMFGPPSGLQAFFGGRTVDFTWAFPTAGGGTAPALWDVTGWTPTSTSTFSGSTALSNFGSIPAGWR